MLSKHRIRGSWCRQLDQCPTHDIVLVLDTVQKDPWDEQRDVQFSYSGRRPGTLQARAEAILQCVSRASMLYLVIADEYADTSRTVGGRKIAVKFA